MAVTTDRHDRPAVFILRVFRDVLTLPAYAPCFTFFGGNSAHETPIIKASPDGIQVLAKGIVGARLPVVLFEIHHKAAPLAACGTFPTDNLERVVVRIPLNNHAATAAIAGAVLLLFEFFPCHDLSRFLNGRRLSPNAPLRDLT